MEPLDHELSPPPKSSIEEAFKFEIKTLSALLRYAYLVTSETLPVILSIELSDEQVDATLKLLKHTKNVTGWQMANIHGISLELCMHMIYMEEDHKPWAQHQR